jgi:hypothetical protein
MPSFMARPRAELNSSIWRDLTTTTTSLLRRDLTATTTSLRRDLTATTTLLTAPIHDSYNNLTTAQSTTLTTTSPHARGIPTTRRWRWRASTKEHGFNRELERQDHCKIWYNGCLGGSDTRYTTREFNLTGGIDLALKSMKTMANARPVLRLIRSAKNAGSAEVIGEVYAELIGYLFGYHVASSNHVIIRQPRRLSEKGIFGLTAYTVGSDRDAEAVWRRYVEPQNRETTRLPVSAKSWFPSLPLLGRKVDRIHYLRDQLQELNQEIESTRGQADDVSLLDNAFVRFNDQVAAHLACQSVLHGTPHRMAPRILDVNPKDVNWNNLALGWRQRWIRGCISLSTSICLIVLYAVSVAFTSFFPRQSRCSRFQCQLDLVARGVARRRQKRYPGCSTAYSPPSHPSFGASGINVSNVLPRHADRQPQRVWSADLVLPVLVRASGCTTPTLRVRQGDLVVRPDHGAW